MFQKTIGNQVVLVVLLLDDFQNTIIKSRQATVRVKGARPPIQKEEGYYVFLNLQTDVYEVQIQSEYYEPQQLLVKRTELDASCPTLMVRLKPSRQYPNYLFATAIEGKTRPGNKILAYSKQEEGIQLMQSYKKDDSLLFLYKKEKGYWEGKRFAMLDRETQRVELFQIEASEEEFQNAYRLEKPLQQDYKKMSSRLLTVYETVTDEAGNYFIPIRSNTRQAETMLLEVQLENQQEKQYSIKTGERNQQNIE